MPDNLQVARIDEESVYIQVIGLGNSFQASSLQSLVESEIKAGFSRFIVDLSSCTGLDSTFMGTFIGLSSGIKAIHGWFCLVNVSDEQKNLLKNLGVLQVVLIRNDFPPIAIDQKQFSNIYPTNNPIRRIEQIKKAHEFLVDIDPENKNRFGAFLDAVNEELSPLPIIRPPSPKGNNNHADSGK